MSQRQNSWVGFTADGYASDFGDAERFTFKQFAKGCGPDIVRIELVEQPELGRLLKLWGTGRAS